MIVSVHQPQYFPWLGYFDKINKSDVFVYLDDVQYKKREWQNRNRIKTPSGFQWLTVPVKYSHRERINEILIQNELSWQNDHIQGLELNYKKTRCFEKYRDIFFEAIKNKWDKLSDLNIKITELMLKIFGIETKIMLSSSLSVDTMKTDRIIDICKKLGADTYLSGQGARDYLEPEKFDQNKIKLEYQEFKHPVYSQAFGEFLPFASAIDMIFNEGEKSALILKGN